MSLRVFSLRTGTHAGLRSIVALSIFILAAATIFAQNTKPDFENDYLTVNAPHPSFAVPGFEKKMHEHPFNRVMIYMHIGGEDLYFKDGSVQHLKWGAGDVFWSPAAGPHYSMIPKDTPPFTGPMIVELAIKKPGDPSKKVSSPLDPLKVDPANTKLEIDNPQVRVIRVKVGPHQKFPIHEFLLNHMVVYMTDQNVRQTSADGKSEVLQHKAAQYTWSGPSRQSIENLADQPFEELVVELKN
jgi:hypothetical protein